MSHAGLGTLDEYSLMVLFGNAHSHFLTKGLSITPAEIKNNEGKLLYPAYYRTYLNIPLQTLLYNFKLWSNIQIGIDVKKFGNNLLESKYISGQNGEIKKDTELEQGNFPYMEGSNLFVVDVTECKNDEKVYATPCKNNIAELERTKIPPKAIRNSNIIKENGFKHEYDYFNISNVKPIPYFLSASRDVSPGHEMIFAMFIKIMDYVEDVYFLNDFNKKIPIEFLKHFNVIERETYYYANCFAGEKIEIEFKGNLIEYNSGNKVLNGYYMPALLDLFFNIYSENNKTLLSRCHVKKVLAIPENDKDIIEIADNIMSCIKKKNKDFSLKH